MRPKKWKHLKKLPGLKVDGYSYYKTYIIYQQAYSAGSETAGGHRFYAYGQNIP
jgi:hypothetical protein